MTDETRFNSSLDNSNPLISSGIAIRGVAIALLIISLWGFSFGFLLSAVTVEQTLIWWTLIAILWQTFLCTGLFITAHDAIHGSIFPKHPQINYFFGSLTLLLYGFFSYDWLRKNHLQHHHSPASESDPDFHDSKGQADNAFIWYICFMQGYWSWWRFVGLIVTAVSGHIFFKINYTNLILFWSVPTLLSSFQLFYFGTFLPDRKPIDGYQDSYRTQSIYRPFLWSFLTCYHFGYHKEHHIYPDIPWWKLPAMVLK